MDDQDQQTPDGKSHGRGLREADQNCRWGILNALVKKHGKSLDGESLHTLFVKSYSKPKVDDNRNYQWRQEWHAFITNELTDHEIRK